MLGNLSEALTNISLELGIWMRNQSSKIWDCALINNCLSELFGVFSDFSKSSCRNSFKSKFWLLNT